MFSVEDFTEKYERYSDEELLELNYCIHQYSDDAKKALEIVLQRKGGIEKVKENLTEKKMITDEINRIKAEADKLCTKGNNVNSVKTLISSDILPNVEVDRIVDERFAEYTTYLKSKSITAKTILLALLGIVISGVPAGILWSWLITQSNRIPIFMIVGLGLFCYFIIIFLTKKPKDSLIVIISTVLAIILFSIIGQFVAIN